MFLSSGESWSSVSLWNIFVGSHFKMIRTQWNVLRISNNHRYESACKGVRLSELRGRESRFNQRTSVLIAITISKSGIWSEWTTDARKQSNLGMCTQFFLCVFNSSVVRWMRIFYVLFCLLFSTGKRSTQLINKQLSKIRTQTKQII